MADSNPEPPQHAIIAGAFAQKLFAEHARSVLAGASIFSAFVALVSSRDRKLSAQCLEALEHALGEKKIPKRKEMSDSRFRKKRGRPWKPLGKGM